MTETSAERFQILTRPDADPEQIRLQDQQRQETVAVVWRPGRKTGFWRASFGQDQFDLLVGRDAARELLTALQAALNGQPAPAWLQVEAILYLDKYPSH